MRANALIGRFPNVQLKTNGMGSSIASKSFLPDQGGVMAVGKPQSPPEPFESPRTEKLDSWKEIAAYLKRDESTVRRWEKEGLPVHRHTHKRKATVYAHKSEIDVWWNDGHGRVELVETATAGRRPRVVWWATAGLLLIAAGLGLNVGGVRDRLLGRPKAGEITSIAVLVDHRTRQDQRLASNLSSVRSRLSANSGTAAADCARAQGECAPGRHGGPLRKQGAHHG